MRFDYFVPVKNIYINFFVKCSVFRVVNIHSHCKKNKRTKYFAESGLHVPFEGNIHIICR